MENVPLGRINAVLQTPVIVTANHVMENALVETKSVEMNASVQIMDLSLKENVQNMDRSNVFQVGSHAMVNVQKACSNVAMSVIRTGTRGGAIEIVTEFVKAAGIHVMELVLMVDFHAGIDASMLLTLLYHMM